MPSEIGIALPNSVTYSTSDQNDFTRMPVWMADQENRTYNTVKVYGELFDSLKWKQNAGDIVIGVQAQHSALVSQVHRPENITGQARVNTHRNRELNNQARIKRHKYMSNQIYWSPDFRDFRKNIDFAMKDMARQIGFSNEFFIRDQMFNLSRHMYCCGAAQPYDENVAFGEATPSSQPKSQALIAAKISSLGQGTLDFKTLCHIRDLAENDLGIEPWDGWKNGNSKDNELMKGKWLIVGANELLTRLTYDATVNSVRPLAMNLLNSRFSGALSDNIVFRKDPRPQRYRLDGSMPPLETEQEYNDATYSGSKGYVTRPHPSYRAAEVGMAYLIGYKPVETIDIGPPPSSFTGKGMSLNTVNALNWNGQVSATRNFLVQQSDGTFDTNMWDEFIKLIASTVHGLMPVYIFNVLPIIYRRSTSEALSWT